MEKAGIHTEYIKLDAFLKYAGFCSTGGEAKVQISGGNIKVNGSICRERSRKLHPGDEVSDGKMTVAVAAE